MFHANLLQFPLIRGSIVLGHPLKGMPQTQPGPIQRVLIVNGLDHLILMCPIRGNGYHRRRKFTRVRVMSRRRPKKEADSPASDLGTAVS